MAKTPVRPVFLAAALAVAVVTAFLLVFVLSKKDFWAELNLVFWVIAGGWFVSLWSFLFFGWGLRGPDPSQGWTLKVSKVEWIAEILSRLPGGDLDLGGDDLLGVVVALIAGFVATVVFLAVLVLFWGLVELVIFLVALALFFLVNRVFRAQVVRNRRAKGRPLRSLGLSLYLSATSVGWLPLLTLAYRWWFL